MESIATSVHGQPPRVTLKLCSRQAFHFGHQAKRWNPKMKPYISPNAMAFISSICSRPSPSSRLPMILWWTRRLEVAKSSSSAPRNKRKTSSNAKPSGPGNTMSIAGGSAER